MTATRPRLRARHPPAVAAILSAVPAMVKPVLRRLLVLLALAVLGALACAWFVPRETSAVELHLVGFPDSDAFAHRLRPLLLAALCFLPALGALAYSIAGALDRYLVRRFLPVLTICLTSLLLIWLLVDLADNLPDLRRSPRFVPTLLRFYGLQFAPVFVLVVPYALLFSLLYTLGRLSNSREIIAIIQTGRGMIRVVSPLIAIGLFATAACTILNYHWAPWADGYKEAFLVEARGGHPTQASNVLYFESAARRLWKVGAFPLDLPDKEPLLDVAVTQLRADGSLRSRLLAPRARWSREHRSWTFEEAWLERFRRGEPPVFEPAPNPLVKTDWQETPWQLIKPGLPATDLGIPDLNSWLRANRGIGWSDQLPYLTQWHQRWAQPFVCLVTTLLAAPLGIVFSRRGASGGVALAVFLCGGMVFLSTVSLAFGESGYLPPPAAAWLTNATFGLVALYLFHRRMSGLPIYQAIRRLLPLED